MASQGVGQRAGWLARPLRDVSAAGAQHVDGQSTLVTDATLSDAFNRGADAGFQRCLLVPGDVVIAVPRTANCWSMATQAELRGGVRSPAPTTTCVASSA